MKKTYYAKSATEHYTFRATDIIEARNWVLNNLDFTQEWTVGEIG
jgi:hypothetical protein